MGLGLPWFVYIWSQGWDDYHQLPATGIVAPVILLIGTSGRRIPNQTLHPAISPLPPHSPPPPVLPPVIPVILLAFLVLLIMNNFVLYRHHGYGCLVVYVIFLGYALTCT